MRLITRIIILYFVTFASSGYSYERIISLSPTISEILIDLGYQKSIIGVLDTDRYFLEDNVSRSVGSYGLINIEKMIELNPDIIFAWDGALNEYQKRILEQLKVPLHIINIKDINDISDEINNIGSIIGEGAKAHFLTSNFDLRLKKIADSFSKKKRVKVFYQVWNDPIYTVGRNDFISSILDLCNAENIFNDINFSSPQVSVETVLNRQPELILLSPFLYDSYFYEVLNDKRGKLKKIWRNPSEALERPNLRLIKSIEQVCNVVNGVRTN